MKKLVLVAFALVAFAFSSCEGCGGTAVVENDTVSVDTVVVEDTVDTVEFDTVEVDSVL